MKFEFTTSGRIIFGNGAIQQLPQHVALLGRKAFLLCGKNTHRIDSLIENLNRAGIITSTFRISTEPTVPIIQQAIQHARSNGCDVIIGIGGGSVIDAGKAVSAMLTNSGELLEYLEVIGEGKSVSQNPAPYIAVPTTAGTGAEVTSNAVLVSPEHKVKVSMRSSLMFPRIALVDPEMTYSMPPAITASTGLDALTQLIEAFVSNKSNPLTDGICLEGLKRASRSLLISFKTGDPSAREDMSIASLFSGIALANAKLGAVHGLAAPLGGVFSAPHGTICARLLPFVMEMNIRKLIQNSILAEYVHRFNTVAQIVTNNSQATAQDAAIRMKNICEEMSIPSLKEFGLRESHISRIVQQAKKSSSTKGNPVELTEDELAEILRQAM